PEWYARRDAGVAECAYLETPQISARFGAVDSADCARAASPESLGSPWYRILSRPGDVIEMRRSTQDSRTGILLASNRGARHTSGTLSEPTFLGTATGSWKHAEVRMRELAYVALDRPAVAWTVRDRSRPMHGVVRAKRPSRIPVVLSEREVQAVLRHMEGTPHLVCSLLYGSGLRLLECLQLRIQDVDLLRNEILVRDGKGRKDRRTLLPRKLKNELERQIEVARRLHAAELKAGRGSVEIPFALERKSPRAPWELGWQWV